MRLDSGRDHHDRTRSQVHKGGLEVSETRIAVEGFTLVYQIRAGASGPR